MALFKFKICLEQGIPLISPLGIQCSNICIWMQNLEKLPIIENDEETTKILKRLNVTILAPDHHRVLQAHKESLLEPYEVCLLVLAFV